MYCIVYCKVVGDYINTMKTTLDFNFYLYLAALQDGYTYHIEAKRSRGEKRLINTIYLSNIC